jgi:hypothetical protein
MSDAQTTEGPNTEAAEVPAATTDSDLDHDLDQDAGEEHLATVRVAALPPVPRPPQSKRISVPPPLPSMPPPSAGNGAGLAGSRAELRSAERPRPSWLHSLLASTLPPPAPTAAEVAAERIRQRLVAAVCAVVAFGLIITALFVGLGGPPADSGLSSSVLAAVVVARALMGVGLLGTGVALLLMGERWFVLGSGGRRDSVDSHP